MPDLSGVDLLNLGCGYKTADVPGVANVDFGIFQRIAVSPVLRILAPLVVGPDRMSKLKRAMHSNLVVYDISKGIPADDRSVGAVYHSHMLEHLDREVATKFMLEVRRVLRPGGIHRIAVPDLELSIRRYLHHLETGRPSDHDSYIADILEQSVRREAAGTRTKKRSRRFVENLLLGDARKRGETHQWMYDEMNLAELFERTGFTDIRRCSFGQSSIKRWADYRLEVDDKNEEYKPGSMYMEASVVT